METRCVIHRRTLFSVAFVVVTAATAGVTATPLRQTNATGQTKPSGTTTPENQQPVPPDHYDPDDTKTWPDVLAEDLPVAIRQQQFTVHFYRPRSDGPVVPAIYACGDGGWRGLAPRTAQQLAHIGFAVAGIDSKVYLRDFSSIKTPLTIKQLARDYADVAKALRSYAGRDSGTPVYVYGWSLGAGFAIGVGADVETRANWAGIISIGLPKQNQLVSGVGGNYANLTVEGNALYGFRSADVLGQIAPVPLVMIQSTSDTASPSRVGRELFASANDPKRYVLIKASNHRFSGAREEFYAALGDAVSWMRESAKNAKP
jgi:dienelactone hydrolase